MRSLEDRNRSGAFAKKLPTHNALWADSKPDCIQDQRTRLHFVSSDLRDPVSWVVRHLLDLEQRADEGTRRHRELAWQVLKCDARYLDEFGAGAFRARIEDACFRILQPLIYRELACYAALNQLPDWMCLTLLKRNVEGLLEQHGIPAVVTGRTKGLYSLYCKMGRLGCTGEEVTDRIGLRVIVPSAEQCFAVLRILHSSFYAVPGTYDDYIGSPKKSGYQALHTCIYPVPEILRSPVEFQIRTWAMHQEAEFGSCAHWRYKRQSEALWVGSVSLRKLRSLLLQHENDDADARFLAGLRRLAKAGMGYGYV